MEEVALGTIGEDLTERHGIILIRFRMKRLGDSGETENWGENLDQTHGSSFSENVKLRVTVV